MNRGDKPTNFSWRPRPSLALRSAVGLETPLLPKRGTPQISARAASLPARHCACCCSLANRVPLGYLGHAPAQVICHRLRFFFLKAFIKSLSESSDHLFGRYPLASGIFPNILHLSQNFCALLPTLAFVKAATATEPKHENVRKVFPRALFRASSNFPQKHFSGTFLQRHFSQSGTLWEGEKEGKGKRNTYKGGERTDIKPEVRGAVTVSARMHYGKSLQ